MHDAGIAAGLASFTREELQALILRLAGESESAARRIRYLLRPRTAVRNLALRMAALRGGDYRHGRAMAEALGRELEQIVADIEQDVFPHHPVPALALTESLLALDEILMEYEDDYGAISRAFEDAGTLWLKAARAARDQECLPLMDWPARVLELLGRDSHGVRHHLLKEAERLLDELELRRLNEAYGQARQKAGHGENRYPRLAWGDLQSGWRERDSAAKAPAEPVHAHALEQVRFHLDCGEADQELAQLLSLKQGIADPEPVLDLLDRAYGQLGDTARRIEVRRERFHLQPDLANYRRLEQLLDEPALQALREQLALEPPAPQEAVTRARVLFAAGLPLLAQVCVLANARTFEIEGNTPRLAALGMEAAQLGSPLAATVVWRALLNSMLNDGRSRDYHIGTRLFVELQHLATGITDYCGVPTHAQYGAALYERHRLKTKFWRGVQRASSEGPSPFRCGG